MAQDLQKRLERARKSFEKNKLRDAISDYQAVLELAPDNLEALQSLGTVYIRQNDAEPAAHYFGLQFEVLLQSGDLAKASAVYSRFLRSTTQPPDRLMRYAVLLQQQTRPAEAVEQYEAAARLFLSAKTIEFHLSNVYRKLGIRSRSELVRTVLAGLPERRRESPADEDFLG